MKNLFESSLTELEEFHLYGVTDKILFYDGIIQSFQHKFCHSKTSETFTHQHYYSNVDRLLISELLDETDHDYPPTFVSNLNEVLDLAKLKSLEICEGEYFAVSSDTMLILLKNAPNLSTIIISGSDYGGLINNLLRDTDNEKYNDLFLYINRMIKRVQYDPGLGEFSSEERQTLSKIFSNVQYFHYVYRYDDRDIEAVIDCDDFLSTILNTMTKLICLNIEIDSFWNDLNKAEMNSLANKLDLMK
ncbi:unnamed protein product [Didymodactylos carnosus]|uniref:Uncharacterized protein n=1 Tax=Didymodactylos carnosus TaxID=1234261 RepID=A0A814ET21_9BILA|nr:unnamed protein product [Didymodactylos carnosus]CAF3746567.1 unnamed protein product [Didymodactylos carnosus]